MATCGSARLLLKAMSDDTLGVLLPGEGSPPGHSREAQQSPQRRVERMQKHLRVRCFWLYSVEVFLQCCVERRGLAHSSDEGNKELTTEEEEKVDFSGLGTTLAL